jgi:2-hydroxychromene-2-carboxylate isomerase
MVRTLGFESAAARIGQPEVKAALRREGEAAIAAGVFGVPSVVVDGTLFWGYDATEMVGDYLRDPTRFRTGEMARVQSLPVGAQRRP